MIKNRHAILVVEGHLIVIDNFLKYRHSRNIRSGCCGNVVNDSVAVDIPALEHIGILLITLFFHVGLAYYLRGREYLTAHKIAVGIVEIGGDPLVSINDRVAVVPAREVFVPSYVVFIGFDVDRYTCYAIEGISTHYNVFGENDIL